jgi:hypothetical protein
MNLHRRLELLEKGFTGEPVLLKMPDGRTEKLQGRGDFLLDLVARSGRGDRTPELELIAQSISSTEPGGGHMIDLVRAFLNGPKDDTQSTPADSVRGTVG